MDDYHELYLCTDILVLTDAFENSDHTRLRHYKLDPTH